MTGVAVVGTHVRRLDDPGANLEESVFHAARATLAAAGRTIDDVDAVVISCVDQVDGRVIEGMVTSGAAGGVGRDLTVTPSASEHALVLAYLRLLAGLGRTVLALAWCKPSEGVDPGHAEVVSAEPFLLRPLGMNLAVAAGLQANAYLARHGGDPAGAAELPGTADVVCGAVLTTDPGDRPAAWMRGVGWASDRYELGERDLSRLAALEIAAGTAYAAAGVTDPPTQIDVAEVQRLSRVGLYAACEALGLSPPGHGFESAGGPVVNPTGEDLADAAPAAGFVRLARAAAHAMATPGSTAVGAALHGFAGQGAAVMVFGGRS